MPSSGVKLDAGIENQIKKVTEKREYRFIIFKISDDKKLFVIDQCGGPDATFDDFKAAIPKDQCRYAIYDLEFKSKEAQDRKKVIFVSYVPDAADSVKSHKMLYSSSKTELVKKLGASIMTHQFHFSEYSEIDLDYIVNEMQLKVK